MNNFIFLANFFLLANLLPWAVNGQDQRGAIWIPSPHHNNGRNGRAIKWLIIHGTAGGSSARGVGSWFQNPSAQASTHYVVGQDGAIVQSVRESNAAWANGRIENGADAWWRGGNPNDVTISIEHVKSNKDNSNVLTPAQKSASFRLVRDIINRHPGIRKGWANANGGITGHYSISPGSRKNCPGPYPWNELFAFIGGGGGAPPPPHPPGRHAGGCQGTVTAKDGLRIRNQASTAGAIVGTLGAGQNVGIVGRVTGQSIEGNNVWYQLGSGRFASGRFLKVGGAGSFCH